eukprot:117375-Rhodomonas_salina.1
MEVSQDLTDCIWAIGVAGRVPVVRGVDPRHDGPCCWGLVNRHRGVRGREHASGALTGASGERIIGI